MSSISPKDLQDLFESSLQDLFEGVVHGFPPGSVAQAAQVVGGKVVPDMPAGSHNARALAAMLGGSSPTSVAQAAAAPPGFSIPSAGSAPAGTGPTGSKSRPFSVEFTSEAANNLAKQIAAQAAKQGDPASQPQNLWQRFRGAFGPQGGPGPHRGKEGPWDKFASAFGQGREAVRPYSPVHQLSRWIGGKLRGALGKPSAETGIAATVGGAGEAGEGLEALAAGAGLLAGTLTGVVTAGVGTVTALFGAAAGLKEFGETVVEGNAHLAKYSGSLAAAMAGLKIGDIQRQQHMAKATSGSSSTLAQEYNTLAQEFQPLSEDLASLKNLVGLGAVEVGRVLTGILKVLDELFGPLLRSAEKYLGQGAETDRLPIQNLFDFFENQNRLHASRDIHRQQKLDAVAKQRKEQQDHPGFAIPTWHELFHSYKGS